MWIKLWILSLLRVVPILSETEKTTFRQNALVVVNPEQDPLSNCHSRIKALLIQSDWVH